MKLSELDTADNYKDIWVLGEVAEGKVHRVTLELLGKAKDLAEKRASAGSKVVCLLMGYQLDGLEKDLFAHHADKVIMVDDGSADHTADLL